VDNSASTGSSKKLIVLANWWIFVVISVPLTILTLYVWWVFTGFQATGTRPQWWRMITRIKLRLSLIRTPPADEENNLNSASKVTTVDIAGEKF
jgi:hypothetical protein